MLKREFKVNLKAFIIWTGIMIGILIMIYAVYPSIISGENGNKVDEMVKMFPPEVLKAFNMDIAGLDSAFGWLKSEGFVFIYLIIGIYASILGSTLILKEESERTVEYLVSLPVTRLKWAGDKIKAGVFYIVSMILALGIFNLAALNVSENPDNKQLLLLSITPVFPSLVLFSIGLFLSGFMHKTKNMLGLSIGIVFAAYMLNVISEMGDSVRFLRYFSVFTLADARNVINDSRINPWCIIISLMLFTALTVISVLRYDKKELV